MYTTTRGGCLHDFRVRSTRQRRMRGRWGRSSFIALRDPGHSRSNPIVSCYGGRITFPSNARTSRIAVKEESLLFSTRRASRAFCKYTDLHNDDHTTQIHR